MTKNTKQEKKTEKQKWIIFIKSLIFACIVAFLWQQGAESFVIALFAFTWYLTADYK